MKPKLLVATLIWGAVGGHICLAKELSKPSKPVSKAAPGEDWVRVLSDEQGQPLALQTAIVRYEGLHRASRRRVTVDLIGAVHIGDRAYYQALNRRFKAYDALLYELVAPEGTVVQPGAKASSRNPLGAVQSSAKNLLELEHQLEQIDYTRPNFVHADMSPEQFFQSMEDRGEGIVQMYMRMIGQGIAMQGAQGEGEGGDLELLFALFAKDRARRLKIAMAKQLSKSEALLSGFGGEQGSTLITERNKVAMSVLANALSTGRRRVGVFYGAGHLEDMHKRLRDEFGLRPQSVQWLNAWDLRSAVER